MFKKLQSKWKVSGTRLLLILCTFALGGSLCGYLARRLLSMFELDRGIVWILLYILFITLLWPLCVMIISIPLGQFLFFRNYLKRIFGRMTGHKKPHHIRIAIFASGAGSNANNILDYFSGHPVIEPVLIVSNNPKAGVLDVAKQHKMPAIVLASQTREDYLGLLKDHSIDFIILAGYLKKIPEEVTRVYRHRIINIHPALLPKYGGPGMYGANVHKAVIMAGEKESGISIHFADEIYDHGQIIFQVTVPVKADDTPQTLAARILKLEHEHYPKQIEKLLTEKEVILISKFPVK